jgi:hypothetical protein
MQSRRWTLFLILMILTGLDSPTAGEEDSRQQNAAAVLKTFEKGYKDTKGYMRPLGDPGWEVRFRALRQLVLLSESATPTLLEAL